MACVLIYVLARREASFHLDDVVYAAALTIGCGRNGISEEVPLSFGKSFMILHSLSIGSVP